MVVDMVKTDFVFVYPKATYDSPKLHPPLSIIYPAAHFMKLGYKVEVHDCRIDSADRLIELIQNTKFLGVSSMTGVQCSGAVDIMKSAKSINPNIITFLGGFHANTIPEQVIKEPFIDFITSKKFGQNLEIEEIYNEVTERLFKIGDLQWFTSTGCFGKCTFCGLNEKWKPKEFSKLETEMRFLHKKLKFKHIFFSDPNIGADVERIKLIGRIFKTLNVTFHANIRNDSLTKEIVIALNEAGCTSLEVGAESGDNDILRKLKKGHDVYTILQGARRIAEYGKKISVMYSCMVRIPGETRDQIIRTMNLIDKLVEINPSARISIFTYTPYPGTELFDEAVKGGFKPPTDMAGWGKIGMNSDPLYWICGLTFRKDNIEKNFPTEEERKIIRPFEELAEKKWKERDIDEFPNEEVEKIIKQAVMNNESI